MRQHQHIHFGWDLWRRHSPMTSTLCHAAVWIIVHGKQDKLSGSKLCKHCKCATEIMGFVNVISFWNIPSMEPLCLRYHLSLCRVTYGIRIVKGIHWLQHMSVCKLDLLAPSAKMS